MSLAMDLSLADLLDWVRVGTYTLDLGEAVQMSRTAGGGVIPDQVAARLWTMQVTLVPQRSTGQVWRDARFQVLREAGRTFAVGPRGAEAYPKADPAGAGDGTALLVGAARGAREIVLSDLGPGRVLQGGDFISVTVLADGRQEFFQIVTGGVANSAGVLGVEVVPPVAGNITGATVQLHKPWFRAVMVPGSYQVGAVAPGVRGGASFAAIQTLRGVT